MEKLKTIGMTYLVISSIFPAIALMLYIVFWILNILDPNASYITFLQNYYYSGELIPGMHAWRVHIVLILMITAITLLHSNGDDYHY